MLNLPNLPESCPTLSLPHKGERPTIPSASGERHAAPPSRLHRAELLREDLDQTELCATILHFVDGGGLAMGGGRPR